MQHLTFLACGAAFEPLSTFDIWFVFQKRLDFWTLLKAESRYVVDSIEYNIYYKLSVYSIAIIITTQNPNRKTKISLLAILDQNNKLEMSLVNITNMVSTTLLLFWTLHHYQSIKNTDTDAVYWDTVYHTIRAHHHHFFNCHYQNVLDNPTNYCNPIQFEITFECTAELTHDIEWKVVYVGSSENSFFDQVLDEIEVGPVPIGVNKFILQTDAPDPSLIPENDLLGITVILVTCSYRDQEFARVGYYVNNEYMPFQGYNPMEHGEIDIVHPIDLDKVVRTIVADKPRVTRFPIQWDGELLIGAQHASLEQDRGQDYVGDNGDKAMDVSMEMQDEECYTNGVPSLSSPEKTMHILNSRNIVSPDWSNQSALMVEWGYLTINNSYIHAA